MRQAVEAVDTMSTAIAFASRAAKRLRLRREWMTALLRHSQRASPILLATAARDKTRRRGTTVNETSQISYRDPMAMSNRCAVA
jgi:hypothetical protein